MQIKYLGHIVYVVSTYYPNIAGLNAIVRTATHADTDRSLGVIKDGRCVPLSEYESREALS